MDRPVLLQTGPETFRVLLGDGRTVTAVLHHHIRHGLGLTGIPPLTVATEMVAFLMEREDVHDGEISLGAAAGRHPEFVEEIRGRLT